MMGLFTPTLSKTKTAAPAPERWTREAFRQLPEGPPYFELEDGELINMVRPRGRHQKIIGKLFSVLSPHVEQNGLGDIWPEVEVDITPTRTYVPDLSYLAAENLDRFEDDIAIVGPPDLVVEISSPSTAARDQSTKLAVYQQAGVPWYWLISAETLVIHEYQHTPDGYLLNQAIAPGDPFAPALFAGLTVNLAELLGESAAAETDVAATAEEEAAE